MVDVLVEKPVVGLTGQLLDNLAQILRDRRGGDGNSYQWQCLATRQGFQPGKTF